MEHTTTRNDSEPVATQIIGMIRDDINKYKLTNFWWCNKKSPSPGRYGVAWDSNRGQFLLSSYSFETQTWATIGRARSLPDLLTTFFN